MTETGFAGFNIEFAEQVLHFAKEHQTAKDGFRHDQGIFWLDNDSEQNECGTAACLAGIASHLHPSVEMKPYDLKKGNYLYPWNPEVEDWEDYEQVARRTLGVTWDQGDDLFFTIENQAAIQLLESYINEAKKERAHE
jgi:hypothetical protein